MDYEAGFISKIVIEKCMKEALDQRLQPELFSRHPKEWQYLCEFYRTHQDSPPPELFERQFPDFELRVIDAPVSVYVEELRNRQMHNIATSAMKEMAGHLKGKNPALAIEEMRKAVSSAEIQTRPAHDVNLCENPEARLQEYHEVREMGGLIGLPSPWPGLDEVTLGFQDEELWMIVARGGVGKTWAEVVLSRFHWGMGFRPLLFSKEMAVKQIARRFDAVNAKLCYQRLRSGQLTHEEYQRFQESLAAMQGALPYWISGDDAGSGGVSGIGAKVERYRPHAVYIDGMYLVEDETNGESFWQRLGNIAWGLKQQARHFGIPYFVSHQFSKEAGDSNGTADTLFGSDIQKWFDGILGMYQTEDLRANKEMLFRLLKQREGERYEFVSEWDLELMSFDAKVGGFDDIGISAGDADTIPF